MALIITDECTMCGSCESECPVNAITEGADTYVIDAELCVECKGFFDEPQCKAICPSDCIE